MAEVGLGSGGVGGVGMGRGMFALSVCVWGLGRDNNEGKGGWAMQVEQPLEHESGYADHWEKTLGQDHWERPSAEVAVTRQVSDCGCASTTPRASCFW